VGHEKENTMPKKKVLAKKDRKRLLRVAEWADSLTPEQIEALPEETVRQLANLHEECRRIKVVRAIGDKGK
jgi:hypothetical protein